MRRVPSRHFPSCVFHRRWRRRRSLRSIAFPQIRRIRTRRDVSIAPRPIHMRSRRKLPIPFRPPERVRRLSERIGIRRRRSHKHIRWPCRECPIITMVGRRGVEMRVERRWKGTGSHGGDPSRFPVVPVTVASPFSSVRRRGMTVRPVSRVRPLLLLLTIMAR